MAPVSERPQAEETSRASTLLSPCAPQAARARAAARGRLRALRAGGRRRLHRRAARPQGLNQRTDRQTRGLSRPAPAPRLRLSSASALRPQRLRPSSTWRAVRVACLAPASMVAMVAPPRSRINLPSISHRSPLDLPLDLRREINAELQVQACHPNAKAAARRCPVALFQFFTDSPDLYVDGNLADAFK